MRWENIIRHGKTSTTLQKRMNNHISGCRTARTSNVFDLYLHHGGLQNNNLNHPPISEFLRSFHSRLFVYKETENGSGTFKRVFIYQNQIGMQKGLFIGRFQSCQKAVNSK